MLPPGGGGSTGSPARIAKTVRNVTAGDTQFSEVVVVLAGDTVEFSIMALPAGSSGVSNVRAEDVVPLPLTLIPNTTKINGAASSDVIDDGYVALPVLQPSSQVVVTFLAQLPANFQLRTATSVTNTGYLTFGNVYGPVSDTASVTITPGTRIITSPQPSPVVTPTPTVAGAATVAPPPKKPKGQVLGVFDVATGSPLYAGYSLLAAVLVLLIGIAYIVFQRARIGYLILKRVLARHGMLRVNPSLFSNSL